MKRIVETEENPMVALLGKRITLLCMNYFYTGKLTAVNDTSVELTDPEIVYETGDWKNKEWCDSQALPTDVLYVTIASIEAYGVLK